MGVVLRTPYELLNKWVEPFLIKIFIETDVVIIGENKEKNIFYRDSC